MKLALIAALIGHIICGVTDCLLAYTPGGRFEATPHNPRLTPLHVICLHIFRHDYRRHQR